MSVEAIQAIGEYIVIPIAACAVIGCALYLVLKD